MRKEGDRGQMFLCVLVTYNPEMALFRKCICSIYEQVSKMLVIDNDSDNYPEIAELIKNGGWENVSLEHFTSNKGLAYAYNYAFGIARDMGMQAVLTLDQDTICPPTLAESLRECLEEDDVAIACPAYRDRNNPEEVHEDVGIKEVSSCINSGALIKVKAWEQVGGYDEFLFVDFTDHEFCLRIRDKGYKIKQVTGEITSHAVGDIAVHRLLWKNVTVKNHCANRKYYLMRNAVYIKLKYGRKSGIGNLANLITKTLVKILLCEKDKWNKIVAVLRGARDGIQLGRKQ
jgi:rhamnosyltransferase